MKRPLGLSMICSVLVLSVPLTISAAKVGQLAPDFSGSASNGKTYQLSDYRGKFVVLEWHNNGGPYTRSVMKAAPCKNCRDGGQPKA